MKTVAVIPVRAGSKRLKNKNILPFADSNLLIHKIRQLKTLLGAQVDKIVVSSDSDEMLDMALAEGVNIHNRPIEYCDDKTKSFNDVVEYVALAQKEDIIMWAPCVCPITTPLSYKVAIETYKQVVLEQKKFDSLISVKIMKEYLFDETKPLNFNPNAHVISQLLPDWKVVTNAIYIASRELMIQRKYFYGENPYLYVLDKREGIDIDDADDFEFACAVYQNMIKEARDDKNS